MTIDYFKTLGKYLGRYNFKLGSDIVLQDDGDGIYIKQWNIPETQPTIQQLTTLYENNLDECSICICNCNDSSNYGNPCTCNGKIISEAESLSLSSRTETIASALTRIHDCLYELNTTTGLATCRKTRRVSITALGKVYSLPLDTDFEVRIYVNDICVASNRTVSESLTSTLDISTNITTKISVGDIIKVTLYNGSLLSKDSDCHIDIITVEEL